MIKTYVSIAEAARETNVAKAGIQFVLRGRHKTAGGFAWKFHVNVENEIIYES